MVHYKKDALAPKGVSCVQRQQSTSQIFWLLISGTLDMTEIVHDEQLTVQVQSLV